MSRPRRGGHVASADARSRAPELHERAGGSPRRAAGAELRRRIDELLEEGTAIWERFDREVRDRHWHPFVASDYARVLATLEQLVPQGARFLEWGSATGTITIMADLLGFDAYGIELDPQLADVARALARRHGSGARFFTGSFLPSGYRFRTPRPGDGRLGTIGEGASAYPAMGLGLDDFAFVYAYPWTGEEALMLDVMRRYGAPDARLLLHGDDGVRIHTGGRLLTPPG